MLQSCHSVGSYWYLCSYPRSALRRERSRAWPVCVAYRASRGATRSDDARRLALSARTDVRVDLRSQIDL